MLKIQAHRGFMDLYPENTMLSFQKAYETGCFGIETDVRTTIDGKFVLIHDATVDRTTNGTGNVSDLTLAEIKALDAGSGEEIPTLIELLDEYRYKEIVLSLHLYVSLSDIPRLIDLVDSKGMTSKVHIFGNMDVINEAKSYNPKLYTMNSGAPLIDTYQTFLDNAIAHNHNAVSINIGNTQADLQTMIQNIKANGKEVHISTLSADYGYETQMGIHISLGSDYILGNNPKVMQDCVNNYHGSDNKLLKNERYIHTSIGKLKLIPYVKINEGLAKAELYSVLK
jgi:glycerophosphoryl diester phosphodiesterase